MPELHQHIVYFGKWCKQCKYFSKEENEEPCDHCLEEPVNTDSHKPVMFKQKVRSKKNDRAIKTINK